MWEFCYPISWMKLVVMIIQKARAQELHLDTSLISMVTRKMMMIMTMKGINVDICVNNYDEDDEYNDEDDDEKD